MRETATHSRNGPEVAFPMANWVTSHRSASGSYSTTPSPSSFVSQGPPKPEKSVRVGTGPNSKAACLENTAKLELTICT